MRNGLIPPKDQLKLAVAAAAVAAAVGVKTPAAELEAGIIKAECLDVKLACNLGVPASLGTPDAGSNIVKLPCLLKDVDDLSLTMTDPEMVN